MIPSIATVPVATSRQGAAPWPRRARSPRDPSSGSRPTLCFVGSAVFHYLGPAFAVLLFARVGPLGTAWLRIAAAAPCFAAWRRPWAAARATATLLALGAVLAVMNCCFYLAIDRLPLGTVAAIEFLPVIVLAALGARTRRNGAALALAVAGVYLLTDVRLAGEPLGFAFAFANAGLFALYIVLSHRVAQGAGLDGLARVDARGARRVTPLAGWDAVPALDDPVAIAAGLGVGVASSVIPYVCDQLAMARLPRATYALMVVAAAGDRDRDRRDRARAAAHSAGAGRRRAGGRRRGGPPRRGHLSTR